MAKLLELTQEVMQDERRVTCFLPLRKYDRIITLDQVRKTKPREAEKEQMLQSFLHSGQHVAGIVAVLTKHEAVRYLEQIGALWNKAYSIDDYRPAKWEGKVRYFMLIAGHMRLDTCKRIIDTLDAGELAGPGKFRESYYAELRFGLVAEEAIEIQIAENVRHAIDPIDEMFAAQMVWKWKHSLGVAFTQADLARMFSRSESWVESSMLMAELPESTQRLAIQPGDDEPDRAVVPRGILLAQARFARFRARRGEPMTELEVNQEVARAVARRLSPAAYDKEVTERMHHEEGDAGQTTMDLVGGFANGPVARGPIRQIVGEDLALGAASLEQNLKILLRMLEEGLLGELDNPDSYPIAPEIDPAFLERYSMGSPIRNMGKLADVWTRLAPIMMLYARAEGGRGRQKIEDALKEAGFDKAFLEELLAKERAVLASS